MIPALECIRKVYRVESGPCFDILTEWREQRRLVSKQLFDWIETKGAVAFIPGPDDNVGNAVPIVRVIFEGELPQGWRMRELTLSTNFELRADGRPRRDRGTPSAPEVAFFFELDDKPHLLACDRWDSIPGNIAAIAAHIEALRGQERWGVSTLHEAFAGHVALPAPEQWWQVLGLTPVAPADLIQRRYRELARAAHPDTGGSEAAMSRLNAARDAGLREAMAGSTTPTGGVDEITVHNRLPAPIAVPGPSGPAFGDRFDKRAGGDQFCEQCDKLVSLGKASRCKSAWCKLRDMATA